MKSFGNLLGWVAIVATKQVPTRIVMTFFLSFVLVMTVLMGIICSFFDSTPSLTST